MVEIYFKMPRDVKGFLSRKKLEAADGEVSHQWAEIEDLYTKR